MTNNQIGDIAAPGSYPNKQKRCKGKTGPTDQNLKHKVPIKNRRYHTGFQRLQFQTKRSSRTKKQMSATRVTHHKPTGYQRTASWYTRLCQRYCLSPTYSQAYLPRVTGDVLVHLLLKTTCPMLKYLVPKASSNTYGGTGNWPSQSLDENVCVLLDRRYILYADFPCPE